MKVILVLFFLFTAVVPSFAASRVALVIGNADYSVGSLRNPEHDVDDITRVLGNMEFDVISRKNLTREKMGDALDQFAAKLRGAEVAFFFYSGHGMELEKQNYLIPVDADFDTVRLSSIRNGNLKLDEVLETMNDSGTRVNIAVIDACRDNPYPAKMKGVQRKLAKIPPAEGTIIAYGTSAKSQAGDGNGRNGIYTSKLLKFMSQPGLNMFEIFRRTGVAVKEATGGKQRPQISYEPMRPFYLNRQEQPLVPLRPATLTVRTIPQNARVRILHIKPKYRAGIALAAGTYTLEVSAPDYQSQQRQVKLVRGKALVEDFILKPEEDGMPEPVVAVVTPRPQRLAQTFTDATTGMKFVLVKGGCYQMGDTFGEGSDNEKPIHEVCVDDFYMGKYEVTQGEWQKIVGSNPSEFKNGDHYPVERVSWNDITEKFLPKLNRRSRKNYRLPTEAEWEYAAREGGKKVRFGNGKDIADPREINFDGRVKNKESYSRAGVYRVKTTKVGSFTPNSLGLYDMSGNVWEWCSDWYGKNYYDSSSRHNPEGLGSGSYRVNRGGSWNFNPGSVRAADRSCNSPDFSDYSLGFRLVFPVH